jgi:hypothetical protein
MRQPLEMFSFFFIFKCTCQVGHVTAFLTIIGSIPCLHLLIAEITKYIVVLFDLTKRVGESEGVIMTCNSNDA